MQQIRLPLFYNLQQIIRNSDFHRKYDLLFQSLDLSSVRDINTGHGRTGFSRHAILRAFIIKHLEGIKSVPRLIEFLDAHPVLTEMCGFDMGNLPDASQFYKFLTDTNTSAIETLHHAINQKLIDAGVVSLSHCIMDSKPVMAATRHNNFKNPRRNTRNKHKIPAPILLILSLSPALPARLSCSSPLNSHFAEVINSIHKPTVYGSRKLR